MSWSKEEVRLYMKERYIGQREIMFDYLGGRKCAKCGTEEGVFHFDHIEPQEKSFDIGALHAEKNWDQVIKELDKCQVLCEDCHHKKTAQENSVERGFTHGTMYGWMKKKCECQECAEARIRWYFERNEKRRLKIGGRGPYKPRK